jgi:hypothetical protein
MPLYLPMGENGEILGEAIHADGMAQADVEAYRLYEGRLASVSLAPKSVRYWRGRPGRALPASKYDTVRQLASSGYFQTDEWRNAEDFERLTEVQKLFRRLNRRVAMIRANARVRRAW